MKITEVRIFRKENSDKKLKAFATITFDDEFVVRDVKVIEGTKGLFVAMPSRRVKEACPRCGHRNVVRSRYCSQCGANIEGVTTQSVKSEEGRQGEHKDIAHPITLQCRETIQKAVLEAYEKELGRATEPSGDMGRYPGKSHGEPPEKPSSAVGIDDEDVD